MLSRKRMPRRAVRFPVRFWRREATDEIFVGYVTNVSAGGMFVATRQPLPPNAAIEVEVERPDERLRLAAMVAHAAKFPPLYQQVFKSGMGIRFERPESRVAREVSRLGVPLADRGGRRKYPRPG